MPRRGLMTAISQSLELSSAQRAQLQETLQPLEHAKTLPPWCYTSPEFYAAEVREIFMKEWIGVGRLDEVKEPGDFFCADIAEDRAATTASRVLCS